MNAPANIRADHALVQGFLLGELRIDPLADEVSGPGGRERLDPKVMDVLVLLAQHAGHVVLRDDLLAQLWPSAVVTDDVLSRCIYELRRHLSQAGGDEQFKAMVETLPKRGYRLNGEVTLLQPQPGTRQRVSSNRLLLALAIAVVAAVLLWFTVGRQMFESAVESPRASADVAANSIAVLPFVDMSAGQDQGYLADGISEEILNRLTQAGKLRVISRTSSFSFRGKPVDIREIAANLKVSHVLEGSVRRSGDSIRITAQLIAASDNSHAWSATYDRELGELFAVQDEIAGAVSTALQVTLAGAETGDEARVKPEAHERYLQGRYFYNRRAPGDIERSVKYYQEALAIDPGYATAWAALAGAYGLLIYEDDSLADRLQPLQGEAARKAVELAPRLAVAHARLSQYHYATSDRQKGDEHFREAQALDPDDPLVMGFASDRAVWEGDLEGAVTIWRRLVERNPLSPTDRHNLASFLAMTDRLEEATAEYRKAFELNPDFRWGAKFDFALVLALRGLYDEAYSEVMRLPEGEARDYGLAILFKAPGRLAEADAALRRLAARPIDTEEIRLAELYADRGMTEEAFSSLRAMRDAIVNAAVSRQRVRPRIYSLRSAMLRSRFLKPLHSDPRWAELMAEPG